MSRRLSSPFLLALISAAFLLLPLRAEAAGNSESAFVGEDVHYKVFYRGLFSAFSRIPVADAELSTRRYPAVTGQPPLLETALTVSTAAYEFIEGLYPFRYRMRTLYQLRPQGSVAFERIKRTRKRKYDLVWVDREPDASQASIKRYQQGENPVDSVLPSPLAQWADVKGVALHPKAKNTPQGKAADGGVLDWLSLLQAVRGLPDLPGEPLLLPVTDGNGQTFYRVSFEGMEALEVDGRLWSTQKFSLTELDAQGEPNGNPIKAWLSADGSHLPLRLQTSHTVGRFIIEYRRQPAAQPVSVDTPIQVAEVDDDF